MAKAKDTERRIYVLPSDLVGRIRRYQERLGLSSEVEAVRKLLDDALQIQDTIDDIVDACDSIYKSVNSDMRALASTYLLKHPKVDVVTVSSDKVDFRLITKEWGRYDASGRGYKSEDGDDWEALPIF